MAGKNLKKNVRKGMPPRYGRIVDEVCRQDRLYFEEHPHERVRWRKYVEGEFWPAFPAEDSWVRVTCVGPGLRIREPFERPSI